jgi:hypothetical protein
MNRSFSLACLLVMALLQSCNNGNRDDKAPAAPSKEPAQESSAHCYRFAGENDTIRLTLVHAGDSINGTLEYKLHEKDRNQGTIRGGMRGDLLVADYTFMSEGMRSVRQVVFKKAGNSFVEGYGDVSEENGRQYFKDIGALRFNDKFVLNETGCR